MKRNKKYYYTIEYMKIRYKLQREDVLVKVEEKEDWCAISASLYTLPRAKQLLARYREFAFDGCKDRYRIVRLRPEVMDI
jgi:hypothetical protein